MRWNRVLSTSQLAWVYFLAEDHGTDENVNRLQNLARALPYVRNATLLDMSRQPFVDPIVEWSREECNAFAPLLTQNCVHLQILRLGAEMIHMVCHNWNDAASWEWLNGLTRLQSLSVANIGLDANYAGDVLEVAMKSTCLMSLDMEGNDIDDLMAILNTENAEHFRLPVLNLGYCNFGWSTTRILNQVLSDETKQRSVRAVAHLLTQYTSLTKLGLRGNEYSDPHGKAVAQALRTVTNLTELDLLHHNISFEVQDEIRQAWAAWPPRQGTGLILDQVDLPEFSWEQLYAGPFQAETDAGAGPLVEDME
jgi:hypothetical protein